MPNRHACSALDEIRNCFKTYNFSPIPGLVEELQSMFNRMEATIQDKKDVEYYNKRRSQLMKECEELEEKIEKLQVYEGKSNE